MKLKIVLASASLLAMPLISQGASTGIAITSLGGTLGGDFGSSWMRGYRFSVSSEVKVSGLAVFDLNADGWAGAPSTFVGLWNETNTATPIATAEVAPTSATIGNSADYLNKGVFRFEELATIVTLGPGTYRVAADYGDISGADLPNFNADTTVGTVPEITYLAHVDNSAANAYPITIRSMQNGYLGGSIVVIPEPSSAMLLGLATLGLTLRRKRC